MVEYRRATLREDDAPETPVESGASLDSVEVSEGLSRPPQAQPWHEAWHIPSGFGLPWRVTCTCPHPPPLRLWPLLREDDGEAILSHDVAQNRLKPQLSLPHCLGARS